MKTKSFLTRLLSLLLAAVFLFAVPAAAVPESGLEQLELLEEILGYIDEYALYPAGDRSLDGITAQMLEDDPNLLRTLAESWLADDPYGHFMTQEEYIAAYNVTGATYGIGVQVDTAMPAGIYVNAFLPGGAAERSGMEIGAQIVSADGVWVADTPYLDARPLLVGEQWTQVVIGYINPGSDEVFYETLTRSPLNVENVSCELLDGTSVGYISIDQFGSIADYYDFDYYYNEYLPGAGAESVIIDLRGNPGGELVTVLNMMNVMLWDEGYMLCGQVAKDEEYDYTWESTGWTDYEGVFVWEPETIVFLVDANSASASEVFSGTMQAYGVAVVVGETTFGKSHSQYHLTLSSGDRLILTESRIELYGLGSYEGEGITPDYHVEQGILTGADMGLSPLDTSRALFRQSLRTERISAMQERLSVLGYYRAEPSGVFDSYTLWCLNRFQAAQGFTPARFANVETLKALEKASDEAEFADDLQLAYAVELCVNGL